MFFFFFFFSSRRRHTRWNCDWSSDVCSSDLMRNPAQRLLRQRLLPLEDGRARDRPVDNLGRGAPGQPLPAQHLRRARFAMRWLRPNDRLSVPPRDHEEALADRRRAIVAGAQLAELQPIAELAKLLAPLLEGLAGARLD